jgi:hypothetical protein
MYETVRLCSGGGAFEAVPRPKLSIDLAWARSRLEAVGVPVTDARVLLIVRLAQELTLSRDGRVLIKTRDPGEADRLLRELLDRLGLSSEAPAPA